jgi:hypothetical protein
MIPLCAMMYGRWCRGQWGSRDFQMVVQDQVCCRWQHRETQGPICGMRILSGRIRSIIYIAEEMGWRIHQMDVKTAFLNGFIEDEVYIE